MAETLTIEIKEGSGGPAARPSPPAAPPAQLPPVPLPSGGYAPPGRSPTLPPTARGQGQGDTGGPGPDRSSVGLFAGAADLLGKLGMSHMAALSRLAGVTQAALAQSSPAAPSPPVPTPARVPSSLPPVPMPSTVVPRPPAGAPVAPPGPGGGTSPAAGGGMGALAGAGAAGAIIAAAMQVKRMAEEGMRGAVEGAGRMAQGVARLDATPFAQGLEGAAKHLPWFGPAIAEASKQARNFADGLSDTARRLSGYNSALAAAQAHADVRQILGDLRRAQMLGTDLGRFTEARSRLSEASQDAMASLLKPLIPLATQVLERLTTLVQGVSNVESLLPSLITGAIRSSLGVVMPGLGDALNPLLAVLEQHLGAIARVMGRAEDHAPARDFTEELLGAGRWAGINGIRPVGAAPRGDVGARFPFLGG